MASSEHDETVVGRLHHHAQRLTHIAAMIGPATLDDRHREELVATLLWVGDHIDRIALIALAATAHQRPAPVPCANRHGCPDDADANKAGRCSACYQYQRRTGRDRRQGA